MIIDVHNHADWHGHDFNASVANMDKYGIDKTWILTREAPMDELPGENIEHYSPAYPNPGGGSLSFEGCLTYAQRAPDRFILGYAPDPRVPGAISRLKAGIAIHSVRIYGELKLRMMYDDLDAIRMYRFCGEKGLPVLVHIDYEFQGATNYPRPNYWYGGGIEPFERAVKKCPETIFIGHAPGFWAHISGDDLYDKEPYPGGPVMPGGKVPDMLRKYPNLYCEISGGSGCNGLSRDIEFAVDFLTEFQDRVMYGRDMFDNRHQEFINSLGLPEGILDKIYYKNAVKLVP